MAAQTASVDTVRDVPVERPEAPSVPTVRDSAEGDIAAGASPARDLQARLEAEIFDDQKMSARSVTAMVLIVCLSTWVAGILLYASL